MADPQPQPSSSRSLAATGGSALPAIVTTFMVGCGFAALKFVLIGRFMDQDGTENILKNVPWDWMREVVLNARHQKVLDEAVAQAMGTVLTFGLIIGFPLNGPLSGAWRCDRLFAISTAVVGLCCMMAFWFNPWVWACAIGIAYGAACAARGKVVPLLSKETGRSSTLISGGINAALAIGLLAGTLIGSMISESKAIEPFFKHLILVGISGIGVAAALFIRVPEPPVVPIARGFRDFVHATSVLFRRHWALLLSGGLSWGITAACSLAIYVHAVQTLHLPRGKAATLGGFAAVGAIIGNLISHWGTRRRWVIAAFLGLAGTIASYPYLASGYWSAALLVGMVGMLFAAPSNVLDARFLANAHLDGLSGLGGTVMSFVHSLCIAVIGLSLAIPLFLRLMTADAQFLVLAGVAVASCTAAAFARINPDGKRNHPRL